MAGFVAADGRGGGGGRDGEESGCSCGEPRCRPARPAAGGLVGEMGSLPFVFSIATL
jgi:hypothetical protein